MSPVFRASLWMIGAIGSFTAMAIAGRAVSLNLDTFEIMTYRSVIGLLIVLGFVAVLKQGPALKTQHLGLHTVRNLAHFTGQNLWFYAITVIPLAQVFALEFTTPIWAILLAPLVLGERITRTGGLSALVGFAGILIVARPGAAEINGGVVAAALCAVAFGLTALFTRRLTRTEPILRILFYLTALQLVFGLVASGYDGDMALPTLANLPWVVVIGCAGLMAHFCLTTALSLAPADVVMPIDFVRLPLIALVGALFYAEPFNLSVLLGGALIFAANYQNIRYNARNPA